MDFRAMSKEVAPEVIELRHDFHQHPEASMAEFRTPTASPKSWTRWASPIAALTPPA